MIKNSQKQNGSALVVAVIVLMVVVISALCYVVWNNFLIPKDDRSTIGEVNQVIESDDKECKADTIEENGIFCSEEIGIKLKVPSVFNGKFEKTDNYEIYKGTVDYTTRTSAGDSNTVYSAIISGNDQFSLTVASEPLRSGYVGIGHSLQNTYYDAETGLLSLTMNDTPGNYAVGDTVPSFIVNGVKFYHGSVGDAGARYETYFAVINGSIVNIMLKHGAYMGPSENDPSTIDSEQVFNELDSEMRKIELVP